MDLMAFHSYLENKFSPLVWCRYLMAKRKSEGESEQQEKKMKGEENSLLYPDSITGFKLFEEFRLKQVRYFVLLRG